MAAAAVYCVDLPLWSALMAARLVLAVVVVCGYPDASALTLRLLAVIGSALWGTALVADGFMRLISPSSSAMRRSFHPLSRRELPNVPGRRRQASIATAHISSA